MIPTKELLKFAKEKAKVLNPHQLIRLKGADYDKSYYLWNFLGATYIGSFENESLKNFFKNKPTYNLTKNSTKEVTATMQLLTRK